MTRFAHHGIKVFSRIALNVHRFSSQVEFVDHINRMKLSGGLQ